MPNDDFNPDLTKLDGDYQVLTELRGEGDSRTYLARHLRLNRDVTIRVFRAVDGDSAHLLTDFSSDARLLAEARHQHIVPVIDGVWLNDKTFAVVHARVRGATLDQSLSASGPMPIARVATTAREIADAINWARDAGVAHRDVSPWDIVFQQGSGRILLSFEPRTSGLNAKRTECDDAQTLRRLTIEMLSGEIDRSKSADEITVPRSIPSNVADALAAIRHCSQRNAESSLAALLTALDAAATPSGPDQKTQMAVTIAPPVASAAAFEPAPPVGERIVPTVVQRSADSRAGPIPVVTSIPHRRRVVPSEHDDAVIVSKPSFGFNARLATAIVFIAALGVAGVVMLNHNRSSQPTVAAVPSPDSGSSSAGEVALRPPAVTPESLPSVVTPPARVVPPVRDSIAPESVAHGASALPADSSAPRKKRIVVVDSAAEAERQFQRDSAADVTDPCLSAEASSQRQCLSAAIERNDRELSGVYARLITALRRKAGAGDGDPDPDAVSDLRAAEQQWIDARDAACREIGDEPLYAKSRAACYAQKATDRARELQQRLDEIRPNTTPDPQWRPALSYEAARVVQITAFSHRRQHP